MFKHYGTESKNDKVSGTEGVHHYAIKKLLQYMYKD